MPKRTPDPPAVWIAPNGGRARPAGSSAMSPRTSLRPELALIIPRRMLARPIDARGYCVPWFVEWIDGTPDFRVMDRVKWMRAVRESLCWLCGDKLGRLKTFVIGPMCAINRTTSEPPSHTDCATFAVRSCPFMTRPAAQYRTANMPADAQTAPGDALMHNPTASALWTTASFGLWRVDDGYLIKIGDPHEVSFWHRGRLATRQETLDAIAVGLPTLRTRATEQGPDAEAELERRIAITMALLPSPTFATLEHAG